MILQAPVDHKVRLGVRMEGVRCSARLIPHQSDDEGSARPKLLEHPRPKEAARAGHEDVAAVPEPVRFTHCRASRQISRAWGDEVMQWPSAAMESSPARRFAQVPAGPCAYPWIGKSRCAGRYIVFLALEGPA